MSEKKEIPKNKKKTRKKKWTVGKLVPVEMPDNPVMKEIDEELKNISINEALRIKNKEKVAVNLFIVACVSSFVSLAVWLFAVSIPFVNDIQSFRAGDCLFEVIILGSILLVFNFYAKKGSWKDRRKKSIMIWLTVVFFALSIISLFIKF